MLKFESPKSHISKQFGMISDNFVSDGTIRSVNHLGNDVIYPPHVNTETTCNGHINYGFEKTESVNKVTKSGVSSQNCWANAAHTKKPCITVGLSGCPGVKRNDNTCSQNNAIRSCWEKGNNSDKMSSHFCLPDEAAFMFAQTEKTYFPFDTKLNFNNNFRYSDSRMKYNTVGIPTRPQGTQVFHTGSFKYPRERDRSQFKLVPMPSIDPIVITGDKFKQEQRTRNLLPIAISNASKKSYYETKNSINKKNLPTKEDRKELSEIFPHGGPPPYPGLSTEIKEIGSIVRSYGNEGAPYSSKQFNCGYFIPYSNHMRKRKAERETVKRAIDTKEILISSLSPPPRLPVRKVEKIKTIINKSGMACDKISTDSPEKILPIYSKVNKVKKQCKNNVDVIEKLTKKPQFCPELTSTSSVDSGRGTQSVSQSPNPSIKDDPEEARNPIYEDLAQFTDNDNDKDRKRHIEVRIEYCKGSKKQRKTRKKVKPAKPLETSPSLKDGQDLNISNLSSKLKILEELKNLKIGMFRVIRLGKWSFVALCCCGLVS